MINTTHQIYTVNSTVNCKKKLFFLFASKQGDPALIYNNMTSVRLSLQDGSMDVGKTSMHLDGEELTIMAAYLYRDLSDG